MGAEASFTRLGVSGGGRRRESALHKVNSVPKVIGMTSFTPCMFYHNYKQQHGEVMNRVGK